MSPAPLKVLFISAEAAPYVKVGGLADVAGALPQALRELGHDVRVFVPRYGAIDPARWQLTKVLDNFRTPMDWRQGEECQLLSTRDGNVLFVENQYFFGSRFQVYGNGDDAERFVLFCRAALEACRVIGWRPDIVHAHDWHAAAALRLHWANPDRGGLVFTIHNMAHQGRLGSDKWPLLGVYDARGPLNIMEQALYTADVITTVSPTYGHEILRPEYGEGLDHMLRERSDRLVGIVNGIDTHQWSPASNPNWASDPFDVAGKAPCKAWLQQVMGLPHRPDVPVIGVVTRLDAQKGIDLILGGLDVILRHSTAQVVLLGSGRADYERGIRHFTDQHPTRVANYIGFNSNLARDIYAGADIFLMPSLFEPCGLSQMIAMRYGTLPVARATGGLVDTIIDRMHPDGTGYLFHDYSVDAMLGALGRAVADYHDRPSWEQAMLRCMTRDFSWHGSAQLYSQVYERSLRMRG